MTDPVRELAELEAEVRRFVDVAMKIADTHQDRRAVEKGMGPYFAQTWPAIARALRKGRN